MYWQFGRWQTNPQNPDDEIRPGAGHSSGGPARNPTEVTMTTTKGPSQQRVESSGFSAAPPANDVLHNVTTVVKSIISQLLRG